VPGRGLLDRLQARPAGRHRAAFHLDFAESQASFELECDEALLMRPGDCDLETLARARRVASLRPGDRRDKEKLAARAFLLAGGGELSSTLERSRGLSRAARRQRGPGFERERGGLVVRKLLRLELRGGPARPGLRLGRFSFGQRHARQVVPTLRRGSLLADLGPDLQRLFEIAARVGEAVGSEIDCA